jgi:hypothetical protein
LSMTLNKWYHSMLVYDASGSEGGMTGRFYFDGVLVRDAFNPASLAAFAHDKPLIVGDKIRPNQFERWIDQAAIWDHAFSTTDVEARFAAGSQDIIAIPGDINGDGQVDGLDLNLLGADWQSVSPVTPEADINGDGIVDGLDLNILGGNWQAGVPAPGAAIPEPASLALLGIGAMAMLRRRSA